MPENSDRQLADVEALSSQLHDIYMKEAKRQGDARHKDAYADLPENIKEFDRVLARFILQDRLAVEAAAYRKVAAKYCWMCRQDAYISPFDKISTRWVHKDGSTCNAGPIHELITDRSALAEHDAGRDRRWVLDLATHRDTVLAPIRALIIEMRWPDTDAHDAKQDEELLKWADRLEAAMKDMP